MGWKTVDNHKWPSQHSAITGSAEPTIMSIAIEVNGRIGDADKRETGMFNVTSRLDVSLT